MNIAQVSPLFESVPPAAYGGTERIVSYLSEELVREGHRVTLFASGDSRTSARLEAGWPRSLRTGDPGCDPTIPHVLMLEKVISRMDEFDVVHFHIENVHFPLARRASVANVTTLHGRLDLPELAPLYGEFADIPVVSISDSQRAPLARAGWRATVAHGLPRDLLRLERRRRSYLLFMGRISPEKRPDLAIEIARRTGLELVMAAKVDRANIDYFEGVVRPMLDWPGVHFIGEANDEQKQALFSGALATLFPIDWPEPFGLVMIESMACGTPVVAFRRGSVPEVIEDGVTGFIVDRLDGAVEAIDRLGGLSPERIRREFETRFTATRMARDYVSVYRKELERRGGRWRAGASSDIPVHGATHGAWDH